VAAFFDRIFVNFATDTQQTPNKDVKTNIHNHTFAHPDYAARRAGHQQHITMH
jgi:hypothetical protein